MSTKNLIRINGITQIGNAYVGTDKNGTDIYIRRSSAKWVTYVRTPGHGMCETGRHSTLTAAVKAVKA